ncbi:CaiB/BaiF CoA transferase family protein [Caballeronia ptereochthonis]|uniref:L-carnitine dehydratase/bile acid-inducible protein F n=1 Tax=Caballeronia ptereochthonis TaxID=1777144 RepID=A0A158CBT9_9BURK|nr:CoA transferase [Caballeronia ptereochthonis]SAK79843.1 L-carnitine dehydratase/bile acid-inducible protein F [Caballeronia ptereochthonis]
MSETTDATMHSTGSGLPPLMKHEPPLKGVRVLDLSRVLAAPFCAMMLADLGAEVIKVEHPKGGDQTRHWGTAIQGGERTYYLAINRNKQSVAIDFSKPEGVALVKALARQSDILVENYLLGTLERYGLGYEALKAENPKLIYCSVSGYGRTGPSAARPGYDSVIQAESGLMSITGEPDGEASKAGVPICDITAGMYATQAILAAFVRRLRNGHGEAIDIALFDCTLANHVSVAANALLLNKAPGRYGNSHADIIPQGLYHAADGPLMFHVGSDQQFARFCADVLGLPGLAQDPRFLDNDGRRANRDALDEIMSARFLTRSRREWLPLFRAAGVPAGLVQNVLEALTSDEARAREMVCEIDHPTAGRINLVNSPLKLKESSLAQPKAPPLLGEHTDRVLGERLGLESSAIERLRAAHIVY